MSSFAVECRAGEGGLDAERFCRQLVNTVLCFARNRREFAEEVPPAPGARTLVVRVRGERAVYESLAGVHRIQRIPRNERRGRRHTSTATVAVIDDAARPSVTLDDSVLDVSYYRGPGPGGQHHQKNATAVRVVHRPTGMVVTVERGRSRLQNERRARSILQARLTDRARRQADAHEAATRRGQISSGERPVKQFTHNDQRGTVHAHATGRTFRLADFERGRIDLQAVIGDVRT